ncbi:ornithine cyclodeaminase family protein [Halomonas sp. M4R5S39]|uniref:ornithine cyclodeaminase family protein n=1 Tax=Halomonas kalidii TaxID=3043293 RepID=UPI0024A99A5B|nr:ornithine cyclodeaminase family protein [Halomonas kalidii]MDI5986505.1 ornithine cyclodeaminase family protein [Halomonas kalidii]
MLVISEAHARELVSIEDAILEVEHSFVSMARGTARNFPVVREMVGYQDAVYGVKAGGDVVAPLLGLKAGGYWPNNTGKGLSNHQSSTLLFDPETGRATALVSANYLTGIRTGASSAIATRYLSHQDASVVGLIGTGVQAEYQLKASMAVRDLERVHAWSRSAESLEAFGKLVVGLGLEYVAEPDPEAVARHSDILITATPSRKALVERGWVKPGTHINAMGCDTRGKQELAPELVAASALFVDEAEQSVSIGEFQHAYASGLITREGLRGSIGQVIEGQCEGRRDADEVTIFDGTGVALQDLVVARLAVRLATKRGLGMSVDY